MAYKRYIKRGDKFYGPYVYHSRKVNGKVISEYHGHAKKVERKKRQKTIINSVKFVLIIFCSLFLIYLAFITTNEKLRIENFLGDRFSITGYVIGADECGTISSPGTYTLNASVSASGTCFTIDSDDVILDCNGFDIVYSTGGVTQTRGVFITSVNNVTVKNCNITDGNWVPATSEKYGIYVYRSNNSLLENNNVTSYNITAIEIKESNNNTLINNNGTVVGSGTSIRGAGFTLWADSGDNLTNNFGMAVRGPGIAVYYSNITVLTNNTGFGRGDSWDSVGILIDQSDNDNLTNNLGIGEELYGIEVVLSNINHLVNNTGTSGNSSGILLDRINNTVLINNIAQGNGTDWDANGIYLTANSHNNTITNNTATSENVYGFFLSTNSTNNTVTNNFTKSSRKIIRSFL